MFLFRVNAVNIEYGLRYLHVKFLNIDDVNKGLFINDLNPAFRILRKGHLKTLNLPPPQKIIFKVIQLPENIPLT